MKVSFIGFGVAGYGLGKGLKTAGVEEVYFYDTHWDLPPFDAVIRKRASETGAILIQKPEALFASSEVIISCVTGSSAVDVAQKASRFLKDRHLYIDVNTTTPSAKEKIAFIVETCGASFVDAAVMGPVPVYLHQVPILASGSGARRFRDTMNRFQMNITCIGDRAGQASGVKMLRSIFQKGLLALLMEMLMAAKNQGAVDIVLHSIAETMEKMPFLELIHTIFTKGVVSADRMAKEMEDVVHTLESFELPSGMARATRDKLNWCSSLGLREQLGGEIPESVDQALEAMLRSASESKI